MPIYKGTTELTKIADFLTAADHDITEVYFGDKQVFTVWAEYDGTLPAQYSANGDYLADYRIYGSAGGVGDEVEITGLSEPLYGIGTYRDSLDLSTGILTRKIKKIVLTGNEHWYWRSGSPSNVFFIENMGAHWVDNFGLCTHYPNQESGGFDVLKDKHLLIRFSSDRTKSFVLIRDSSFPNGSPPNAFQSYIVQQYERGTPVTVWCVLAEPEVSTITVPSGLTGTIEGYLIQNGTPTPETPIYPTANGVKQADDTYSIKYGYKLDMSVSDGTTSTTMPIYIGDTPLGEDEYVDYGEGKIYRMSGGVLTPTDPPVPLPALPTVDGTNIVDYAGQSASPSRFYAKYRKEGGF